MSDHPPASPHDKNSLLRESLARLADLGMVRRWATSESPLDDLERDCASIIASDARAEFKTYALSNPLIPRTVDSFLAHYSSAAFARADQIPQPARLLAQRGVWLGLWIPTFLVLDGPLARFLRREDSPLNKSLRSDYASYPHLAQARDLMNNDLFRRVRNGVAHWSFMFDVRDDRQRLVCFDPATSSETADLDVADANALHLASFAIVECLDQRIFREVAG